MSKQKLELHWESQDLFDGLHNGSQIISILNSYCPEKELSSIWGTSKSSQIQFIQIGIKKCENATLSPIICAPQDQIDAYFSARHFKKRMTLYATSSTLDPKDGDSPIEKFIEKTETYIPSPDFVREVEIEVIENILHSDTSYIAGDYKITKSPSISSGSKDQLYAGNSLDLVFINIKRGEDVMNYYRTYTKLGEVLSFLGGLGKAISFLVALIAIPYNEFKYKLAISNEIYEFETHSGYKGSRRSERSFSNLASANFSRERDRKAMNEEGTVNKYQVEKEKLEFYHPFFRSLLTKDMKLHMSFVDYLKDIFFCSFCKNRNIKEKANLYSQAERRLKQDIDIMTVLKKLQDVDKLKQLLLKKHQRELFNYKRTLKITYRDKLAVLNDLLQQTGARARSRSRDTTKVTSKQPKSSVDEEVLRDERHGKYSMFLPEIRFDSVDNFVNLFYSYKELKKDKTDLNKKLINSLGHKVKTIFEMVEEDMKKDLQRFIPAAVAEESPAKERNEEPLEDNRYSPMISMNRFVNGTSMNSLEGDSPYTRSLGYNSNSSRFHLPSSGIGPFVRNQRKMLTYASNWSESAIPENKGQYICSIKEFDEEDHEAERNDPQIQNQETLSDKLQQQQQLDIKEEDDSFDSNSNSHIDSLESMESTNEKPANNFEKQLQILGQSTTNGNLHPGRNLIVFTSLIPDDNEILTLDVIVPKEKTLCTQENEAQN